jgi:hypothetical protein
MNAVSSLQRTRIDVEQFHRMAEAGVFPPQARIELVDGELIDMPPIGHPHCYAVDTLTRLLYEWRARQIGLAGRLRLSFESPVTISRISELEPDVLVLRSREDDYRYSRPTAEDVLLLIEVAESSLRYDSTVKLPLYARHGVAEVWILDLVGRRLHAYREPTPEGYSAHVQFDPGTVAAPGTMPELELNWSEALT